MIYIGIDPGQSGAMAILNEGSTVAIPFKNLTEDDLWTDPFTHLQLDGEGKCFAMIEKVGAMPGQGVVSMFTFGQHYGMLRAFLCAARVPREMVTPQKWQKYLGCMSHGDKNVTKAMAQRLFPSVKITHAIADALLIAEYCKRIKQANG